METELLEISPVMPSQNIDRDVEWYEKFVGFQLVHKDKMYAVLRRKNLFIHLQWHADTIDDPLLGGSVIKIFVKNIESIFKEFVKRGTVKPEKLQLNTDWKTNEFGFYDLNNNAIFIVEAI
ncbi:VOC family protein [Flavivirga algicola]|uniref:Glyoxalase/bleomycin resistance/extradiol dioxygenase family protein n=1 Tax=Flavivirga algicola TaxID=2729136 RepID=A0ABX1RZB9_9FLAO|nr:glyoxalase/bleomycin resistance/extradiol dioxygenase family protein [Flavivirga algicola]NMH87978.1 glyoxalase/bleomycin resistance/extradiol dioxygenase family protein [Flavivirga algicola]